MSGLDNRCRYVFFAAMALLGAGCASRSFVSGDSDKKQKSSNNSVVTRVIGFEPWDLNTQFIDVRGVGDSGWSKNFLHAARSQVTGDPAGKADEPGFGSALDAFDPSGKIVKGDLNFINWESVVGEECQQFKGNKFLFLSHPGNILQAIAKGFHLFAVTNNHTRDCHDMQIDGEKASEEMTARAMENALEEKNAIWHGLSRLGTTDRYMPRIKTFVLKGKSVRVAFNALHIGRPECPTANCFSDRKAVMAGFGKLDADLKVLSIHCLEQGEKWEWVTRIGEEFIKDYGGDIVFGHGPHVWKPVHLVPRKGGGSGVVFSSLGNFIHPGLIVQRDTNAIGRVLLSAETFRLVQVQWLTIATKEERVWLGDTPASAMGSYDGTIDIRDTSFSHLGKIARVGWFNVPQFP